MKYISAGVKLNLGYSSSKEVAIARRLNAELRFGFHANHGR